jgi:hypothetical protein
MARYTLICEHFKYDEFTGDETNIASKHTTEFRADDLNSVLEEVEMFLKGSGFHFDGVIDVVKPEEERNWDDEDDARGNAVMSSMVNEMMNNPFTMKMPGTLGSAQYTFDFKS